MLVPLDSRDVRVIVRDMAGKYAWDATQIHGLPPVGLEKDGLHRAPSPPPRQRTSSVAVSDAVSDASCSSTSSPSKAKIDILAKVCHALIITHRGGNLGDLLLIGISMVE